MNYFCFINLIHGWSALCYFFLFCLGCCAVTCLFSFGLLCSSKRCLNLFERLQAYLCFRYFDHTVGNVLFWFACSLVCFFVFVSWLAGWLLGRLVDRLVGLIWFDLFCFVSFRLFGLLCLVHPLTLLACPWALWPLQTSLALRVLWSWFHWWWGSKARFRVFPMSEDVCLWIWNHIFAQSSPRRSRNNPKSMLRRKGPTSLNKELKSMMTQKMTRPFLGLVKN